jgi:hypothetical protein
MMIEPQWLILGGAGVLVCSLALIHVHRRFLER